MLFTFVGVAWGFTVFIPETLAPVLLRRKAEKIRKTTGQNCYTLEELEKLSFSETLRIALIRPFLMILQEPIVIFMSCCVCFFPSFLDFAQRCHRLPDLAFIYSLLCMFSPDF